MQYLQLDDPTVLRSHLRACFGVWQLLPDRSGDRTWQTQESDTAPGLGCVTPCVHGCCPSVAADPGVNHNTADLILHPGAGDDWLLLVGVTALNGGQLPRSFLRVSNVRPAGTTLRKRLATEFIVFGITSSARLSKKSLMAVSVVAGAS